MSPASSKPSVPWLVRFAPGLAAFGAVLMLASISLVDVRTLRTRWKIDRVEVVLSVLVTLGVVVDVVPIPLVDATGLFAFREAVESLGAKEVRLSSAGRMAERANRAKRWGYDVAAWGVLAFPTLEPAVEEFTASGETGLALGA